MATPTAPTSTNGDARGPLSNASASSTTSAPASTMNRKKQKRRQKQQAARLAAEQSHAHTSDTTDWPAQTFSNDPSDAEFHGLSMSNNPEDQPPGSTRHFKNKEKKDNSEPHTCADGSSTPLSTPSATHSQPSKSRKKKSELWNQSSVEERENIRAFWFELGEEDRRQLVKVEKDAVLKKMKEQQKHSCSCTVCGRKRTAIEEELEVLYDAYYEELEQYAIGNNEASFDEGAPIIPPPRLYQQPLRSPGHHTRTHTQFHPSRERVEELEDEDEDDLDEEYEEDDEEDGELDSGDEFYDDDVPDSRSDFFAFGNSLTVKGELLRSLTYPGGIWSDPAFDLDGILTVADDLLKNDGRHFIDMMEQLAERRMQREDDHHISIEEAAHQPFDPNQHHHPPRTLDDDDYDEEEEDYDSQDEEEYDVDEMVPPDPCKVPRRNAYYHRYPKTEMTDEQRMQEGRRMFQIFAARMFEQRVMTAYRERVAEQRQNRLIEELMEEKNQLEERNAKKARNAQQKKDKKKMQKQLKDEEKARRDAAKAAEEAAAKAAHDQKLQEQRLKREEQRKKRDAERKTLEDERARKEAEKQKRLRDERDRHADAERKQRELKEENKKREEAKRKEKLERDKRAKEEHERKVREEQAKKARETAARAEQEAKERAAKQARMAKPASFSIPGLQMQTLLPLVQSQPYPATTPVAPKVSTPVRPRQPSQQSSSHTSSPYSQSASSDYPLQPSISPRSFAQPQSGVFGRPSHQQQPPLHHPQPSAPLSPLGRSGPPGFPVLSGLSSNPPGLPGTAGRPLPSDLHMYSPSSPMMNPLRGFNAPSGISIPPGMNGLRSNTFRPPSFEPGYELGLHHGAYGRFNPLNRPPSVAQDLQDARRGSSQREVDDLSTQLGSSALNDAIEGANSSKLSQSLPGATGLGTFPVPSRASFQGSSFFAEPFGSQQSAFPANPAGWSRPFGTTLAGSSATWGSSTTSSALGNGWTHSNVFAPSTHHRGNSARPVTIRLLIIRACKEMDALNPKGRNGVHFISPQLLSDGYHNVREVLNHAQMLRLATEPHIRLDEVLDICDTEGSPHNGGGSFSIKEEGGDHFVRFDPDTVSAAPGHRSSVPGDIGSPIPGNSHPDPFAGFAKYSNFQQYNSPAAGLYGGTS
ncbi:hypothetical protein N7495_008086 [Penicillium taxi]|uniref:uncharacterized protein n=1 Tax=Penicillium taxi TaxID=168475 RepID=UPI00254584E0|nr:uncharacterized protein N7495_008086 [Penicillium taxi]KAJ5888045.1 hypothetical protein N7495_008086 [Penicillium taxi]